MHLYRGTATALGQEIAAGTLVPHLRLRFAERMLYSPTESEVTSWARSLPAVARELITAGLDEV